MALCPWKNWSLYLATEAQKLKALLGKERKGEDPQISNSTFLHGSHNFERVQNIREMALNCQSK